MGEAKRTAVEAQRADLEAAIRRLEQSLEEARQGPGALENYRCRKTVCR